MAEGPTGSGGAREAAADPMTAFFKDAVAAHQRAIEQAQGWSVNVMKAYREQAEDHSALLRSMSRSMEAMESLIESQTRATRALGESLDASRELLETVVTSHQKGLDRMESLVTEVVEQVGGHVKSFQARPDSSGPGSAVLAQQQAAYLELTRNWMDALTGMMGGASGQGPGSATGKT